MTDFFDEIVCPHCKFIQNDTEDLRGMYDGETSEVQCEDCYSSFILTTKITYLFRAEEK
jgi:DNA-directed RNA polymerase subunit RPC12/RpoP